MTETTLTTQQVADILGVHYNTVRRSLKEWGIAPLKKKSPRGVGGVRYEFTQAHITQIRKVMAQKKLIADVDKEGPQRDAALSYIPSSLLIEELRRRLISIEMIGGE